MQREIYLNEWVLIYTPKNDLFDQIVEFTAEELALDESESVDTIEDLETMLLQRKVLAGIIFDHPAVLFPHKKNRIALNFTSKPIKFTFLCMFSIGYHGTARRSACNIEISSRMSIHFHE